MIKLLNIIYISEVKTMSNDIGKITVRQAMILFIILFFAPAIRYIPLFSAGQAKQAAWLSPLFAFVAGMIYTAVWWVFLKKYEKQSFVDIIKDIMGKILGNIIIAIYFLWITIMLAYNLRIYAQRMISTVMTGVDIVVILIAMLLIVGYVLRSGLIPLAKMGELIIIALFTIFFILNFLILPEIQVKNFLPITYKDLVPAFTGSFGILAIFSYNILLMLFNDKIDHKGDFKRLSTKTMILLSIMSLLVILIPLGTFGWSVLVKMPIPYLTAMSQISLFHVIERVESGVIMFWVFSDFILISLFAFTAIHILKLSFNLSNIHYTLFIYLLGIFLLSLIIASSDTELKVLSEKILTPFNIIMGLIIPILIFGVGKIRKKV